MVMTLRASVRTEKPKPIDTSGLSPADWALCGLDNAFRSAHFLAVDAAAVRRKVDRLNALLDDPVLAVDYPADDPDRMAAMVRQSQLVFEHKRLVIDFVEAARSTASAFNHPNLAQNDASAFVAGIAIGWTDSPALPLALTDAAIVRLRFWDVVLRRWQQPRQETFNVCPF